MRLMVLIAAAVVLAVGCGSESATDSTPSTEAPPTTVTRQQIGQAIADGMTGDEPRLAFLAKDPEGLAEIAAGYCAALELDGREQAREVAEQRLTGYIRSGLSTIDGEQDFGMTRATLMAQIMAGHVEDVALDMVCPELSEDRFLPDN